MSDSGSVFGLDAGSISGSVFGSDSGLDFALALSFKGKTVLATPTFIPVSSPMTPLVKEAVSEPPSRSPLGQNAESWPASSVGLVSGSVASAGSGSAKPAGLGLATPADSGSATPVSSPTIPSSSEVLPRSATPLVS
jgi:hypothetical protein